MLVPLDGRCRLMIRTVQHNRCNRCGRYEPAHIGRHRARNIIVDKPWCLGCGAKWRNQFQEVGK